MKRSTWIVLVIFLILASLMVYLNKRAPAAGDAQGTPTAPVEFLIPDSDGQPNSIAIQSADDRQVAIERNEGGVWVLKQPIETEADQGKAEAAASQMTALRIVSKPIVALADAGLDPPSFVLTVKTASGIEKTVRIGDLTPTGSGYYAQLEGNDQVLIVSQTGLDSLLSMLDMPPVPDTPTPPPPTAAETFTATPEAKATITQAP